MSKIARICLAVVGAAMVTYQAIYALFIYASTTEFLIGHLGFALLVLYVGAFTKAQSKLSAALNIAMMLVSIGVIAYLLVYSTKLQIRGEFFSTTPDTIVGILLILCVLEATRREYGWILPGLALLLLLYGLFGYYIPGPFQASKNTVSVFIAKLTTALTDSGMFGTLLSVSALYVFLFMLFASFIGETRTTDFFAQLGKLVARRFRSGPALAAVVNSALVGSVTGQVGANVAITGSYTIPAMKTAGYTPEQAGGIEAAASTSGPIIPPVMGVAAFLMAGMTGIPYSTIIVVAIIPALFYVICAGISVELTARKANIQASVGKANIRELLLKMPIFLIALLVIIFLFTRGAPPLVVGFWATVTVIVLGMMRKETRLGWRNFLNGFTRAAQIGSGVAATCATLGIVVGTLIITGLAIQLPIIIGDIFGGNLVLLLIMAGATSIILGCGLPSSAAYILVAVVLVPLLLRFGVPLLPAHYFAFYFANFSFITPPVAIAAVFAAKLAGSNYMKTSIEALKVGVAGFLLPFMIVWVPGFMGDFSQPFLQIVKLITVVLMLASTQLALTGYCLTNLSLAERSLSAVSALTLIVYIYNTNWLLLALGLIAFAIVLIWQWRKRGTKRNLNGVQSTVMMRR